LVSKRDYSLTKFVLGRFGGKEKTMSDRFISFRLSEDAYEQIEEIAKVAGKKPNEWCRELVESEAGVGSPLSGT
jgi:hypothetical protein